MKDKNKKVLLVRGARQVGKTWSIRKLGEQFNFFLEVNFEENPELASFFDKSLNPFELCEKLSLFSSIDIVPGGTLLFFDEIQACPNALRALRFFHEKMPDLHVVAAGSLFEFAISEIPSFGVGRIRSLYMHPMTFSEYLIASGEGKLNDFIMSSSPDKPVDPVIHEKILEKIKVFQLIGGMPEVVKTYIKEKKFNKCRMVIDDVLNSLIDDFAKYKKRSPVIHLQEVFSSYRGKSRNQGTDAKHASIFKGPKSIEGFKSFP
ncbi:MAG: AAA family ATPase [Desulfobacterales bacterium]|nr:AAA family ATPase [Desulfobacterales bacterium]